MNTILLDTHALLWWKAGSDRLSRSAQRAVADAKHILVSPISFWEVALLAQRGRITLNRSAGEWTGDVLAEARIDSATITPHIAVAAARLEDLPGDPADRFLAATAIELGIPIVSKDRAFDALASRHKRFNVIW